MVWKNALDRLMDKSFNKTLLDTPVITIKVRFL